jgi:hypothetical protein
MKRATYSGADAAARCTTIVNYKVTDPSQKATCSADGFIVPGTTAA